MVVGGMCVHEELDHQEGSHTVPVYVERQCPTVEQCL